MEKSEFLFVSFSKKAKNTGNGLRLCGSFSFGLLWDTFLSPLSRRRRLGNMTILRSGLWAYNCLGRVWEAAWLVRFGLWIIIPSRRKEPHRRPEGNYRWILLDTFLIIPWRSPCGCDWGFWLKERVVSHRTMPDFGKRQPVCFVDLHCCYHIENRSLHKL